MRISDWSSDVCSSDLLRLDALEVLQRRIVDHVHVAGEKRSHAWAVAGDRPEGDGFPGALFAPVVGVALEDDLVAAGELLELVHPGADGGLAGVEVLGLRIALDAGAAVPTRLEERREGEECGGTGEFRGW